MVRPAHLGGVRLLEDRHPAAVDHQRPLAGPDLPREEAVDGVAGEQPGQHVGGHHVVDRRQLDLPAAAGGPRQGAADAAETVDSKA